MDYKLKYDVSIDEKECIEFKFTDDIFSGLSFSVDFKNLKEISNNTLQTEYTINSELTNHQLVERLTQYIIVQVLTKFLDEQKAESAKMK